MEYQSFLDCYSDGHFDSSKFILARKKEHVNKYGHINDTLHVWRGESYYAVLCWFECWLPSFMGNLDLDVVQKAACELIKI